MINFSNFLSIFNISNTSNISKNSNVSNGSDEYKYDLNKEGSKEEQKKLLDEITQIQTQIVTLFKLGKNPEKDGLTVNQLFIVEINKLQRALAPCTDAELAQKLMLIKIDDATLLEYAAVHGIYVEFAEAPNVANLNGINATVFSTLIVDLEKNEAAQAEMYRLLNMKDKPTHLTGQIENAFRRCTKNMTASKGDIPLYAGYTWKNSLTLKCAGTVGFVTFGSLAIMAILEGAGLHDEIENATKKLANLFDINNSPLGISSPGAPHNTEGGEFKFLSFTAGMFTTAAAIAGVCADSVKQYRKNR